MYKLTLFFCIFFHTYSAADIKTIFSLKEAQHQLELLDSNALVIFDVDETLIISLDKIRRKHPEEIISQFTKIYFNDRVKDIGHQEYLDSIRLKMSEQKLIESQSAEIIDKLHKKNIRVIALTHMHAGRFSTIQSMEEWRYQQLYNLAIDLTIGNPTNLILKNLPKGTISHPVFHKGILATSRSCSKGQALVELLKQLNWQPSSIIFFDDYQEHVNSVYDEMKKLNIPCTAFHYRTTEIMDTSINFELAKFQYQYLFEHETWLDDNHATKIMNNKQI